MRKTIFVNLVTSAIIFFAVFTSVQLKAQTGNILVGGGLGYATGIENLGIFAKGVYQFNKQWEVAPQFVYYLEKDNLTWLDIFLNGNFVFHSAKDYAFYGSAGLTLTRVSYNYPEELAAWLSESSSSHTETNLNLGAGVYYNLSSNLLLNGDLKYTIGDADHLFLGVGLMYKF
ncbi:hypothetical protein SDC9_196580 [bioreactor metagenome]|uniref:Outer membrane protein beta-barrel domain-containing protein n=1 Tax=bioreactor metagenome TaxID=1076179 RepID=A0A645ICK0_9ZZZZ